jgi:hypothetical protein
MITAKHKTVETYWVYRYKQSGKQIDSISFKYLDSLDVVLLVKDHLNITFV